ncbi:MAG TPA: hypothetical protein VFY87_31360 [Geminicoccaceae bacterium]|nr:hypothetical protein [Geminicoccaceae bacterium]
MRELHLRLKVHEDGSIEPLPSGTLPPGEHEAVVMIQDALRGKPFSMEDFPVDHGPWDNTKSLRREDMYGDDGR